MTEKSPLTVDALTPAQITEKALSLSVVKTQMPWHTQIPLAILAGFFIGLGALFCSLSTADPTLSFAVKKIVSGLVFSLGLFLVVVAGAELYTGNTMVAGGAMDGRISWGATVGNWVRVWCLNFVGALALVTFVFFAHVADMGPMASGMMGIAVGKLTPDWTTLMFKGILCNLLVCLGVWLSFAARSVADRLAAVVLPVAAFVALGFEHCVANMYFLPMAYVLKLAGYAPAGVNLDVITLANIAKNLSAATVGNTIAGLLLVGLYRWAFAKRQ